MRHLWFGSALIAFFSFNGVLALFQAENLPRRLDAPIDQGNCTLKSSFALSKRRRPLVRRNNPTTVSSMATASYGTIVPIQYNPYGVHTPLKPGSSPKYTNSSSPTSSPSGCSTKAIIAGTMATGRIVAQITHRQIQAPATAPVLVSQISDGQIQAPATPQAVNLPQVSTALAPAPTSLVTLATGATKGNPQAPVSVPVSNASLASEANKGQPQVTPPTSVSSPPLISEVTKGQPQAPVTAPSPQVPISKSTPATTAPPVTEATESQPQVPASIPIPVGSSSPLVTKATKGQPQVSASIPTTVVPSSSPVTGSTEGQPQVPISTSTIVGSSFPPVTEATKGQPQIHTSASSPSAPFISKVTASQPQALPVTPTPVTSPTEHKGAPPGPSEPPILPVTESQPKTSNSSLTLSSSHVSSHSSSSSTSSSSSSSLSLSTEQTLLPVATGTVIPPRKSAASWSVGISTPVSFMAVVGTLVLFL